MEIFVVQFVAAALGATSTAAADWLYHRARIRQRVHSLWVSASLALICLPVLAWLCWVFLGFGLIGQSVAGILVGTIFLSVYRTLSKLPPPTARKNGAPPSPRPAAAD